MSILDYAKTALDYADKYKDLIKIAGSAGKAYLDYKNQKELNELSEEAYKQYMQEKQAAGQEAQAAVDINLTPMEITGIPKSKADVTSFQKVAQGGIIGLKNGGDPNAGITALRKKAPGVVKRMGFESGSNEDGVAIQEAEADTVTFGTYGSNISFPRKEGESEEMAILNGLFNNDTLDEETKQSYYRILIPQVYKNGEISKKEYDAMIEEIIVNKAKGGIIGLRKKYFKGSDPDDYDMDDRSVMEILRDEEGTTIEQQFEDEFGTLDNTAFLTGEGVHGIDRAKRIWLTLPDDIQGQYGDFMNFFESTDWHGINMKKGGIANLKNGGFPDLNKDGKVTKADVLKGRGVFNMGGGVMDLGGMEKDYRFNGGFVPIGEYEKKDDVPARLSKNEFVFTADAVRAAGGGSINKGAKKMYDTMKTLEAQPTAKRMTA